ncbi:alpha/beta hydrolase [Sphingomonas sp. SUN039]|uniref:alpha/beta hydrolase n=1 Tax=Sphingomonas sp. SUN039 TaxID=2937787 RepID=UPI002164979F|nr:alpha/beta hydrolase [Sphingomonas sp. SUN039]UVO54283.1 alpha/beta hydrolase [Sphingomonas sp. SUN039]
MTEPPADPYVRPDVRAFLDMMAANPRPPFTAEFIAQIRKMPIDMAAMMDLPVGELGEIRELTMPGPGGDIALRLFDVRASRDPGSVVVFFHGGGFCLGNIDSHAGFCGEMARQLDLPVVSVDYRLAPENPWPAGMDDGEAAARWITENGAAFGREFTGLILCGDSAGGDLCLVTALALRGRPAVVPLLLQVPIYPLADHSRPYPSRDTFGNGYALDSADMAMFDLHYACDKTHWRASPLLADLEGMAPTVLVTASLDPLRDGGRAFAAKLVATGVPTCYYEATGSIHGFCSYRRVVPSAQGDIDKIMALARTMLGMQK